MVKCTNGIVVIEVTEGAFETIFKDQGYRPVDEKKKRTYTKPVIEEETIEATGDNSAVNEQNVDDEFATLLEKPIAQWSNDEVKNFAEAKGINISGTRNAKEAKARIRKFLEDAE